MPKRIRLYPYLTELDLHEGYRHTHNPVERSRWRFLWTLARAHARSGDRIQLAAYMGTSPRLDKAIDDFAEAYAAQTERDHAALVPAVENGRINGQTGV